MAEVKKQIAFEELGLGSLLKRYQLRLPPNQREYAWGEREVTQLLQDFARAVNVEGPYFLGTVVTIPRDEGALDVVDGQQRLATSAILLSAIRDHLRSRNEDVLVQSIDNEFLSGIDRDLRVRVPKLTLNTDDNELFKNVVTNIPGAAAPQPLRASHHLLLAARAAAGKQVENIVALVGDKGVGDELNRWVSFIEHRALVVLLRVPDAADAYRMFETLNDRGLRTSQADLIKNFLFSRAGDRLGELQSRWSYMRGALESASEDPDITITFLRHAMILLRGYVREADLYESVQYIVKSQPSAVAFAATLETLSNDYVATFNSNHERWNPYPDAARRALDVLNLIDIRPMRPLLLAVTAKVDTKQATPALNFLISLGVRLMIASSTRSSSVELPLADAAKSVFEGKIATATKLREALKDLTPANEQFRTELERARVSNAKLARYYLRSLQTTANNEPEPWFVPQGDQQVINLEHVLPKKPEANWPGFNQEKADQLATKLGNLALMRASDNANLRSMSFADKKPVYAASPYSLTSQIAEMDEWTEREIETRQRKLAEFAVRAWPI